MSYDYATAWARFGPKFQSLLDFAEQLLRDALRSYSFQYLPDQSVDVLETSIEREHSGVPQVVARWLGRDGMQRATAIRVIHPEGESDGTAFVYDISISAWIDDIERGSRFSAQLLWASRLKPDQLRERVHGAIDAARSLDSTSLVQIDSLPPLPAGLSERARERLRAGVTTPHGKG